MIVTESATTVDGKPYCVIKVDVDGAVRNLGQMSPDEMRRFAMHCFVTAEAAETDAMILKFMTEEVGIDLPEFGKMLGELREYRGMARIEAGDELDPS